MPRSVPEWIGKTDDSKPPPRVRLRILGRHNNICYRSKREILPGEQWALDHIRALCNGGQNRESNMAPILLKPHRDKTSEDLKEKSKIYRTKSKHYGIKKKTGFQTNRSGKWKKKVNGQCIPRVKA